MYINNQKTIGTPFGKILDKATCADYTGGSIGSAVEDYIDKVFDDPANGISPGNDQRSPTPPTQ
jgi:hypothetical protein